MLAWLVSIHVRKARDNSADVEFRSDPCPTSIAAKLQREKARKQSQQNSAVLAYIWPPLV